ncbi:hypothetical protein R1flu_026153 [Riccia fluitans]|uniref:Uncharacterized protein n=1 Tax=Riccia fluitans TaxID=41844 RepID=A0ABD1XF60_9MARC
MIWDERNDRNLRGRTNVPPLSVVLHKASLALESTPDLNIGRKKLEALPLAKGSINKWRFYELSYTTGEGHYMSFWLYVAREKTRKQSLTRLAEAAAEEIEAVTRQLEKVILEAAPASSSTPPSNSCEGINLSARH